MGAARGPDRDISRPRVSSTRRASVPDQSGYSAAISVVSEPRSEAGGDRNEVQLNNRASHASAPKHIKSFLIEHTGFLISISKN